MKNRGIKGQRMKPHTPTQATDAFIEKKNRRKTEERNREWDPNPATLDHSVTSYNPHGSYGEPIFLLAPPAHTGRRDV